MQKKKIGLCAILAAMLFAGCGDATENVPLVLTNAVSQINAEMDGQPQQLHDYDSPYTICYQNKDDTYSLYIFASPIQYKTGSGYVIIDNTVIPSKKKALSWKTKQMR